MSDLDHHARPLGPNPLRRGRSPAKNGFGLAALVLGICSFTSSPLFGGVALGVPGVFLGIMGIRKVKQSTASNMKSAVWGVALSVLSFVISVAIMVLAMAL